MACFPTSTIVPRTLIDRAGIVYNPLKKNTLFAKDLNNIADEVVAISDFLRLIIPSLGYIKERKVYNLTAQVDGELRAFTLPAQPIAGTSVLFYSSAPFVMIEPDFEIGDLSLALLENAPTPEAGQTLILVCNTELGA